MNAVTEKVKQRGYWQVRVLPNSYSQARIELLADLERAVQASSVGMRGWNFPHYDQRESPVRHQDYIEQALDWEHHVEHWRAYRSGQFIAMCGLWDDWRDQSVMWKATAGWKSGQILGVHDAVARLIEIFEFAARWSREIGLEKSININISLNSIQKRELHLGPRRIPFSMPRICNATKWKSEGEYPLDEILSEPQVVAIKPAQSLFELFGWDASEQFVKEIQAEARR